MQHEQFGQRPHARPSRPQMSPFNPEHPIYSNPEELIAAGMPPEVLEFIRSMEVPPAVQEFIENITQEVRQQEALQAQFVSDVSHEIRTPLTAIRGTAETLLEGGVPPEMEQRFLEQIVSECDRLTRLANDLLALQRAEATELELAPLNLRTIADNCALLVEQLMAERQVKLIVAGEAPDVMGNSDAINQILMNLIENASRYSGAGGAVRVELAGMNGYSVIAVKDTGPGFGDEVPAHLFDRFYRADQARMRFKGSGNSGLGLAIVKALAQAMGGTVDAANLPERGAVFMVALPSITLEED